MSLTIEQKHLLISIDNQANQILSAGGSDEDLMKHLYLVMESLKKIMDLSTQKELNTYCQEYNGFYRFMKLLEKLAVAISKGDISVS